MSNPFVGEIRMFGGNFAPAGWALCQGQSIPISENDVLFNLIGTTYGGDGQQTFNLPDLQGRFPMHMGTHIGQTFVIGQKAGVEQVTLTANQIPQHNHLPLATNTAGNTSTPTNAIWAANSNTASGQFESPPGTVNPMAGGMLSPSGGNQPHDNMPPYLCVNFIISLFGVYPTQS